MRLLGGDDGRKAALLERQHVNSIRLRINTCRVANDVDEPVKRMQAPEEIIVFPIGARQERGEMAEADALQALDAVKSGKRTGVLRADSVDQNLVELTNLASARHREGQHVPERKAEIIDKYLPARLRMPLGRIERSQEIVDFTGARIEVDLDGELLDQPIELGDMLLHEAGRVGLKMPDLRTRRRGGLIGKAGIARDVRVNLLAPGSKLPARDRPIERRGHDLPYQLIDVRTRAVDNRPEPAHLLVELDHARKLVDHRLRARDIRQRTA